MKVGQENGNNKVYREEKVFKELCVVHGRMLWSNFWGECVTKLLITREMLHKIWQLNGGFDIIDEDNGFFMVKFVFS